MKSFKRFFREDKDAENRLTRAKSAYMAGPAMQNFTGLKDDPSDALDMPFGRGGMNMAAPKATTTQTTPQNRPASKPPDLSRIEKVGEKPIHLFQTEKGSTYAHYGDGTTIRDKAQGIHAGEAGIQPRSGRTIYVHKDDLSKIQGHQQDANRPTEFIPHPEKAGEVAVRSLADKGDTSLKNMSGIQDFKKGDIFGSAPYKTTPEVDHHPLEIWDSQPMYKKMDDGSRIQNNVHFGDSISNVASPKDVSRITSGWGSKGSKGNVTFPKGND